MLISDLSKRVTDSYTLLEVERALRSKELLYIYASTGDMDSINLSVDAEYVLSICGATELQVKTMELVWRQGYTLADAGREFGVSPQAIKFSLDLLKVKLKRVLDKWDVSEERLKTISDSKQGNHTERREE